MSEQQDYIAEVLSVLTREQVEESISSYLDADDKSVWLGEIGSKQSVRHFLVREGQRLPAKAIAKHALKSIELTSGRWSELHYENLYPTDFMPIFDRLEIEIWDEDNDGKLTDEVVKNYEWSRRLARRGQSRFRAEALKVWGNRCAVSGITLDAALEAAHVDTHTGGGSMKVTNSILLRVDLHRLFDGELMAIDPATLKVCFGDEAAKAYPELSGKSVTLPEGGPSAVAFNARWAKFESR